jgi:hypothetical protein
MPDREHEEDRERDEDADREHEAKSCTCALALASQLRVSARAVVVVRAVDRPGVDGRIVLRRDTSGGLGHAGSLVPLSRCFDDTFVGSG